MNPGGLVLESFPLERRAATLDLVMLIIETASALSISIRYNSDLFDPATIVRVVGHFEQVLRHIVTSPDVRLNELREVLAKEDRQQQLAARKTRKDANHQKLTQVKRKPASASQLSNACIS
jgi:non-ribosomal peptide synthetase component F